MWRRFSGSLTLRIFAITVALLVAACALTYGALAYLTPITYTTLIEDELDAAATELVARLAEMTPDASLRELHRFGERTGASVMLYTRTEAAHAGDEVAEEPDLALDAVDEAVVREVTVAMSGTAEQEAEEGVDASLTFVEERGDATAVMSEYRYPFQFSDGREAELVINSTLRGVNRTTEAMRKALPALAAALLVFSVAGATVYARFITRPIVDISGIAGRLARQDFTARWQGRRRDEIGALGESLNQLSDSLSGALSGLREANEALRADIERERELERQRLEFFSATSHELKTPITILKGQLSGMLAQVGAYRDREKYLARALEVVGRMEGLTRQILTVSRLESGEAGDEIVDLSAMLARQLAQIGELTEAREQRLSSEIAPGVTLRGSEKLLSSALDNVLMNAVLYSPPGAEIRAELTPRALRIVNGGACIDEADLPRLFEPFYRAEKSRNRASGGSGLGLYLVKRIFDLHGVACAIKNTPEGVLFEASLSPNQGARGAEAYPSATSVSEMPASV